MPLFFLAPDARRSRHAPAARLVGETVTLSGSLARHLGGALRHRRGDHITMVDEEGTRWRVELTDLRPGRITAALRERLGPSPPPALRITLAQALLKGSHTEYVFQKATELGATAFVPLTTQRTIVRPRSERHASQLARWETIVLEAAQQSSRGWIPNVSLPQSLATYCTSLPPETGSLRLVLWEGERTRGLRDHLDLGHPPEHVTLLVGPEGGFDREEVEIVRKVGFVPVSLGHAIVRAETAGPAALAVLQYLWGDLGRGPTEAVP